MAEIGATWYAAIYLIRFSIDEDKLSIEGIEIPDKYVERFREGINKKMKKMSFIIPATTETYEITYTLYRESDGSYEIRKNEFIPDYF